MRFLLSIAICLLAHVFLGWSWSAVGGLVCGFLLESKKETAGLLLSGFSGAACVGISWGLLIAYNFVVSSSSTNSMLEMMGGIMGNLHGSIIVLLTLFIGSLIGLTSGLVGAQFSKFL